MEGPVGNMFMNEPGADIGIIQIADGSVGSKSYE